MGEVTMTQVKAEGEPAFPVATTENDNSAVSSTGEQTNAGQTGSPDQDKKGEGENGGEIDWSKYPNLTDHPRWKEREGDWTSRFNAQEQRHVQDMTKLQQMIAGLGGNKPAGETVNIPEWFAGDENQWKQYEEHTNRMVSEALNKTIQGMTAKSEEEQKAVQDATDYMNSEIKSIESDKTLNPQGLQVDKNKLLKFVYDNKLVDTEGKWNYRAAFRFMKAEELFKAKEAVDERKKIANATNSDSRPEMTTPKFRTSQDFQKPGFRPW